MVVCLLVQDDAPPPAPSEFDSLDIPTLKKLLMGLRSDTERVAKERNQAQIDRVCVLAWCMMCNPCVL